MLKHPLFFYYFFKKPLLPDSLLSGLPDLQAKYPSTAPPNSNNPPMMPNTGDVFCSFGLTALGSTTTSFDCMPKSTEARSPAFTLSEYFNYIVGL